MNIAQQNMQAVQIEEILRCEYEKPNQTKIYHISSKQRQNLSHLRILNVENMHAKQIAVPYL